jgi:hypothetical protein
MFTMCAKGESAGGIETGHTSEASSKTKEEEGQKIVELGR